MVRKTHNQKIWNFYTTYNFMYTSFYNLKRKPFQISSDPDFMWFGEKHKEALATLKYGILDNKGFLLLTGDVGTGKTTLINSLIQSLSNDVICTSVPDPGLEKMDFFNYIAEAFGMEQEFSTKGKFIVHFRKFLLQANENNKKVLLIIDEAQLLTQEMLEEIRLLSNIEKVDAKLINIFFVGQNEFNEILNREQNRAVRQRLTLNYNIDPLTPDETAEYIKHRLAVAGTTHMIFDESATQEVFMYSGGFPRRINVICDHSLLSGYVNDHKIINNSIVSECAIELKIPAHIQNRDLNGFAAYHERKPPPKIPSRQTIIPPKQYIEKTQQYVEEPHRKKDSKVLGRVILFLFLILTLFAWFFLFPQDLRYSTDILNKNFSTLKYNISRLIPEPYLSFFSKKSDEVPPRDEVPNLPNNKIEQIVTQGGNPAGEIFDKKKTTNKIINTDSVTDAVTEIHPIQDDFLKKTIKTKIRDSEDTNKSVSVLENEEQTQSKSNLQFHQINEAASPQAITNTLKIEPQIKKILPLPDDKVIIRFQYNTNDFTEEGFKKLALYSDILAMHPEASILVSGYTDSAGYQKYNRKLSEFRANIVKSFLMGRGIKNEQVEIRGLGSKNPIESNDTAWGRTMNRRVEIEGKQ
ncbi:MAG: AAA family ATPase [Desulfobacula sp.]|nr:AAA family ATPase [Desulfobacula sp.]